MNTAEPPSAACDYCGLPLTFTARLADEPLFCCFGCRLASSIVRERDDETTTRWTLTRIGISLFFAMNVMVFTMAMWSGDVYDTPSDALAEPLHAVFRYLCLLCSLPVLVLLGTPLLHHAWLTLRRGQVSSELLIVAGVTAAFVFSAISVFRGQGHIYFEVSCMVLVLVTLGRWLEASGRTRATAALNELEQLLPSYVTRVGLLREESVKLDAVHAGDELRVRAGERFATDAEILRGRTMVDEQIFTGESLPVEKVIGARVLGGTINLDGDIRVRVTASPRQGSFAQLLQTLREARSSRCRYQRAADRVAQWFVPFVAVLAVVVFAVHARSGTLAGLMAALSVVLIACPCALGLATPLAVWTALSRAAQHQVLFRNGTALEQLASVRAVRFDKTGTLTDGSPRVVATAVDPDSDSGLIRSVAYLLADSSTHVFSRALTKSLDQPDLLTEAAEIQTEPGRGVRGLITIEGAACSARLGSFEYVSEPATRVPTVIQTELRAAERRGAPVVCLGWGELVRAVFVIDEQLRPEARQAVLECGELGLDVAVLTGDRSERADHWSTLLQVPVCSGLTPQDKVNHIREAGRAHGSIAMVGDGINDAPALAVAEPGIALGCGADLTRDSGSVCITSNDLTRVPFAVRLARRTRRVVRQNLGWAFAYNTAGMALAATGRLNPAVAAGLMLFSSVVVIINSLRLSVPEADSGTGPPGTRAHPVPEDQSSAADISEPVAAGVVL